MNEQYDRDRCPRCQCRFYAVVTNERYCVCDPREIRDLLAAELSDLLEENV